MKLAAPKDRQKVRRAAPSAGQHASKAWSLPICSPFSTFPMLSLPPLGLSFEPGVLPFALDLDRANGGPPLKISTRRYKLYFRQR